MPDDHSEVVPLLPIPNRTVKRLCADDSAGSRVKVGHRQAITARKARLETVGLLPFQDPVFDAATTNTWSQFERPGSRAGSFEQVRASWPFAFATTAMRAGSAPCHLSSC